METRYQVFVSSTYRDLVEERREVIQALLELDCIPAGMELFLAANDDQWSLIQSIIDDCDYYIVIVGGRYGSLSQEGVGYTEREYDYATSIGKPILGFVHENPGDIKASATETDPESLEKLQNFRAKVMSRPVRTYSSPDQLGSVVSRSLVKLMKSTPAEGWVKGRFAMTEEAKEEISRLRAQVAEMRLSAASRAADESEDTEKFAQGADIYDIPYERIVRIYGREQVESTGTFPFTWDELFAILGPAMMDEGSESQLRSRLNEVVLERYATEVDSETVPLSTFIRATSAALDAVKVQFRALRLIEKGIKKRTMSDKEKYWKLTERGDKHLVTLVAIGRSG